MKVRALQLGYYGHRRKREGEVFELVAVKDKKGTIIPPETQFSARWMEKVDANAKSKKSESKLKKESDDSEDSDVI